MKHIKACISHSSLRHCSFGSYDVYEIPLSIFLNILPHSNDCVRHILSLGINTSDNNYLVRIEFFGERLVALEVGYASDNWCIKL